MGLKPIAIKLYERVSLKPTRPYSLQEQDFDILSKLYHTIAPISYYLFQNQKG